MRTYLAEMHCEKCNRTHHGESWIDQKTADAQASICRQEVNVKAYWPEQYTPLAAEKLKGQTLSHLFGPQYSSQPTSRMVTVMEAIPVELFLTLVPKAMHHWVLEELASNVENEVCEQIYSEPDDNFEKNRPRHKCIVAPQD